MKKQLKKLIAGASTCIASLSSLCAPVFAEDGVDWIKNGADDGGVFSSLLTKVKGLGQDAYSLMIVIGAAVAVICLIALGISLMVAKQAQKRDENKTWLVYVFIGGVVISGGVSIAGIIMKIGAGL